MDRMKAGSVISLLLLSVAVGSCTPTQAWSDDIDLLSTGLVGWQRIGGQEGTWRFEDGILYTEGENGGWLATRRQYDDFMLSLEFRVSPGGNSGVFIRAPLEGNPAYAGLEVQILDDYAERWRDLQPYQYTASIYDVQAPSEQASREADEWQTMVIAARGPRVRVILNGEKVIDTNVTYYPYKLDTHPGLRRQRGYIGLQNHGSRVEFRNVRIRELSEAM